MKAWWSWLPVLALACVVVSLAGYADAGFAPGWGLLLNAVTITVVACTLILEIWR
jgi:hypothetical protein